jgi:aminoglycoside/choline kinase family phosphotransferase
MMLAGEDMREPMSEAVAVLADMARKDWPEKVPLDGETYQVPPYDIEAQMIEVDLLASWFWPHVTGTEIPARRARSSNHCGASFSPSPRRQGRYGLCATIIRRTSCGCRSARG